MSGRHATQGGSGGSSLLQLALAIAVPLGGCAAPPAPVGEPARAPIATAAETLTWSEGPAAVPGSKLAILEGDPKALGLFTLRVFLPAGARLAPHTHPNDERVTVLSGSVFVGYGDVFDTASGREFKAGDYYMNPPGVHHYVWSDQGAVLQMTALGPWKLDLLSP